jgi:hypothetical protein
MSLGAKMMPPGYFPIFALNLKRAARRLYSLCGC